MATLYARSTVFFSQNDEAAFDYWLFRIAAITDVRFVGATLEIDVAEPVSDDELRDLLGFFYRYNIEMTQLVALEGPKRRRWFRGRETYWRERVFGKGQGRSGVQA